MQVELVEIDNGKGIIFPEDIAVQYQVGDVLELVVQDKQIMLVPVQEGADD